MKILIDIPESDLLYVNVPDSISKFEIVNYGYAGTYLMESDSKNLNSWKLKIPNGNYEILGYVGDVLDQTQLYKANGNFVLRRLKF